MSFQIPCLEGRDFTAPLPAYQQGGTGTDNRWKRHVLRDHRTGIKQHYLARRMAEVAALTRDSNKRKLLTAMFAVLLYGIGSEVNEKGRSDGE